jgi:pimeloyl-ACP methyl ester carboxylesterase
MEAAAERFVDTVAFGPGAWSALPRPMRDTFIQNAPTFLDESNDPEGLTLDLRSLAAFDRPSLVTAGTESPPFFKPITAAVADALPSSTYYTFEGAGHVPHLSHPALYVETVGQFCAARATMAIASDRG